MARYDLNKFMRRVNMDAAALAAYRQNPVAYVSSWCAPRPTNSPRAHPDGGHLEPAERRAFEERDFGALYAMGAHPYLLWSFTEAVWIHEKPRSWIVETFRERAQEVGYPDFAT